jgi:4-amino-4-deoxy-L-arabinose transferase-like glycosyltransferase
LPLAFCLLVALALRLAVWRWRYFYGLGGDEGEYLEQALALLQQHRYVELRLMRPPLYAFFLVGSILLFDSLVQNLRLVQACVSAATVLPVWLLARELFPPERGHGRGVPLVAALLCALSYTLAANAAELLSETLFLFGLAVVLWLLVGAGRRRSWQWALPAGLALGALCLTRSVALPLLPLGALWLFLQAKGEAQKAQGSIALRYAGAYVAAACLVILPWTARNYATYGGLIVIDTTGAENLWLDNNPAAATPADPLGREAAKGALYALGDDRLARQRLASQQGVAAILGNPRWFVEKAGGELLKFFALEYADDMRARPEIWVPPAEVAARLLLGDGLWLLILLAGAWGLATHAFRLSPFAFRLSPFAFRLSPFASRLSPLAFRLSPFASRLSPLADPRWLLVPWSLYVLLTALIFHVELRYRLPLFPALLPYAAFALLGGATHRARGRNYVARLAIALLLPFAFCLLTLAHEPYPSLAWQLAAKHIHLARAESALAAGAPARAQQQAQAALARDERSALARVALARVALARGDEAAAEATLREAIGAMPAHPLPHLLLGDLLRASGRPDAARDELAFETASLQDLQAWSWQRFATPPPGELDVGGGLDLGFVRGMHPAEEVGWRWTTGEAQLRLAAPGGTLRLRLASGRPAGAPQPTLLVRADGATLATLRPSPEWQTYELALPGGYASPLTVELRVDTFRPRDYDRASGDDRALGVMLDSAAVTR